MKGILKKIGTGIIALTAYGCSPESNQAVYVHVVRDALKFEVRDYGTFGRVYFIDRGFDGTLDEVQYETKGKMWETKRRNSVGTTNEEWAEWERRFAEVRKQAAAEQSKK